MGEKKNIYAPDDMSKYWDKIEKIAEKEDRSISYLVNQAVKEYIERRDN